MEVPAWLQTLLGAAGAAAGLYAAIRADLARLHERATHALHTAADAHRRIDLILTGKAAPRAAEPRD